MRQRKDFQRIEGVKSSRLMQISRGNLSKFYYLKDNYAGQSVKKIEMNKNEYEVELTNGLDFTFNKHFQLIDID